MSSPEQTYEEQNQLSNLNFVRLIVVLFITLGYASTMPYGPEATEKLAHFGYDPSWIGIQVLFFLSGYLGLRSLRRHGSAFKYLKSRFFRNITLLAVFTLVTVIVIYPILGVKSEAPLALIKKLAVYYVETVTCINPGQTLPGLLDDAKYMCLIQGAIWTFKWGALLHIGSTLGQKMGLFNKNWTLVIFAITSTVLYFILVTLKLKMSVAIPDALITANHLAMPFTWGMAVFACYTALPNTIFGKIICLVLLASLTGINFWVLPWTPAIEILLTAFWAFTAWTVLTTNFKHTSITRIPDLTLSIYLINWPASQLLLLAFPDINSWELVAMSLSITVLLAWITHILLTSHLNNWITQLEKSPSRPPAFSHA